MESRKQGLSAFEVPHVAVIKFLNEGKSKQSLMMESFQKKGKMVLKQGFCKWKLKSKEDFASIL